MENIYIFFLIDHQEQKVAVNFTGITLAKISSNTTTFFPFSACQAGYFLCNDRTKCIEGSKFQNGVEDCKDGSDEGIFRIISNILYTVIH